MKYYLSPYQDAAYNQALEEHLYLAYPGEGFLLLWRNRPAVVCGKFQNIYQEVNILEAKDRGVDLVRRISGGGTVYQDLGNINYSLIGHKDGLGPHYQPILDKICASLALLGAQVQIIDGIALGLSGGEAGLKISGSAQASSQDRLLHHGTLLYDADLSALHRLANGHNENFSTRGTRSVPWPVTNLRDHLAKDLGDSSAFLKAWLVALQEIFDVSEAFVLSETDRQAIDQVYQEKYKQWTWTFAQGPAFSYKRDLSDEVIELESGQGSAPNHEKIQAPGPASRLSHISYTVKKGLIQELSCEPAWPQLSQALVGLPLEPGQVKAQLDPLGAGPLLSYLFG
ncbi:MAG: biotin/lipoate A/B protein ligase family protein [Eubacteriales bacterium]|nr:biotin/lipoate A/B protein ligase family protein [Clostridiales bacterium]MDY5835518.1 biotin/lipoate A/B protein ligase family protein [Eubacteriales bacterium]